jgi:hypothetical protein
MVQPLRRTLGPAASVLLCALSGCGRGGGGSPPSPVARAVTPFGVTSPNAVVAPSNPTVTPPVTVVVSASTKEITVTDADHDKTFVLHRGQQVKVHLGGTTPPFAWSIPQTSNDGVMHTLSAATGPGGSAEGVCQAVSDGTAEVTATEECSPPCMASAFLWKVTVTVRD